MGGMFMNREGPSWLPALVNSENFFSQCNHHTSGKNERNQFCFDCPQEGPLCPEGLAASHRGQGHATIQIRRASHRDVVRISDIQKYVDLANIQPYTINSAKIVFLQSKPQTKIVKGAAHYCEWCHRSIADPVRFCSISCKLAVIQQDPHDFTLTLTMFSKSGPGFFTKGCTVSVGAMSSEHSAHSHGSGIMDFTPDTPMKNSKRSAKDTQWPLSKKVKVALSASPSVGMSVLLPRDDELRLSSMSPMAPPTPTYESGPKVHHRKQVRPHRAPMF